MKLLRLCAATILGLAVALTCAAQSAVVGLPSATDTTIDGQYGSITFSGTAVSHIGGAYTFSASGLSNGHAVAGTLVCADTSGSGTAQSCTTSPSFTPAANDCVIYTTTTANTGTGLTLNVDSLGAKSIAKWLGTTTLAAGDISANSPQLLCYTGTVWNASSIANAPTGGGGGASLSVANAWTAAQTFSAGAVIAANQFLSSSDGSSASWALKTVPGSYSVLTLGSNIATSTAISAVETTSLSWAGLYTATGFGTPVPTFVRTGSAVAGTQLTDSVAGDPLVIAPSGNAVRIGVTGGASTLRVTGTGLNADWTKNAVLGYLNGVFTVDNNASASCTVGGTAYTTAFDCAYANAKAWASSGTLNPNQNNATLLVGSNGQLTTNVGIQEPTASSNHATVNIIGRGVNSSYLKLATSLSAGVCMFTQPDETTAYNSAYLTVQGLTLDMNGNADCAMNVDGIKSSAIRDIKAINVRATTAGSGGYIFKFGGLSSNPNGLVFETFIENVETDGLAGGFTPAILSCSLTAGNPVCSVSDGGIYPGGVGRATLYGTGNGSGPCSVYPTSALSFTGTALTSVTFTGGTCVGTVYAEVTPPPVVDNAFLFNSGFTDSTVKDIRAVVGTNYATVKTLGHPNTFIHVHPYAGQPVGIEDHGSDIYTATECDSLAGFCAAFEGPGSRFTDTQIIYNDPTRYAGSAGFYLDQSVTAPTMNVDGVTCNGNRQAAGGYHSLVIGTGLPYANTSAAGGAVDAGYAIPNDNIQVNNVFDCSSGTSTNAFLSHVGTSTLNGRVKIAPASPATSTTTGVNSPILDQIGYAWNSGLVTNDWQSGHSDGTGFSNYFVNAPTNGSSVQYEFHAPGTATSGTNVSSVPFELDASVWHSSAAVNSTLKIQAVPLASGADSALEYRFTHSGSDTGATDFLFSAVKSVLFGSETVTFSATPTFSTSTRASYIALTTNITSFTLAAGLDGQEKTLIFCQNGTGGNTVTAPSNVSGFVAITVTANACSAEHFTYSATATKWVNDSQSTTGGGGSGFTDPDSSLGDMYYFSGTAITRLPAPTTGTVPYSLSEVPGSAPNFVLPGIGGRTISGTTDTIVATDRGSTINYTSSSATAVTFTSPATLGNNFDLVVVNTGSGTVTLTLGAGNFVTATGSSTTLTVVSGQNCALSSPDNTNILPRCSTPAAAAGISNIQITVGTSGVSANTCATAATATMTGLATTSTVNLTPSSDVSSTTGWSAGSAGQLYFTAWPTANTLNYRVCNPTSSSITPGASTTWNVSAK